MTRLLPLFIALPLGCAFLVNLFKNKKAADVLANLCTFILLILSLATIYTIRAHGIVIYKMGNWIPPIGISLVVDGLTVLLLVTVNLISFLSSLYSIGYMEKYTAKPKFYSLFLLMLTGMNGLIVTGDLFNMFVFLELAGVASYALVAFGTEAEELEASFKYMVLSSLSASFVLLGVAMLYSYTSSLNMADIALTLAQKSASPNVTVLFISVLFLMGFGLKAAIVPFHPWLPDAHPAAPAPISAMLSGVLIKALGIYAMLRVFFCIFGASPLFLETLCILGVLSMIVGVILAIGQWDVKRLLAYHSISQIGYILLGIGLGTPLGILGGLFHLFNHSMFKSLLFFNSGSLDYAAGTRNLKEMGGLKDAMPVTEKTCLVASLSISGIPPFNGFWSKLFIIVACVQAKHPGYALWAIIGSLLTLSSFMKVMRYAFYGMPKKAYASLKEVPSSMQAAMVILAIICLLGGVLLFPLFRSALLQPAVDVLINGKNYASIVFSKLK
ncbi:MAG: proton-conducting transporter membrane subunit [Candidatus Sumerlaeota bacterium]|nr:proton-conducting transporter membrane subunit [Candidatus Sumerlaeota bacterium]